MNFFKNIQRYSKVKGKYLVKTIYQKNDLFIFYFNQ